jgi:hypothetical protein
VVSAATSSYLLTWPRVSRGFVGFRAERLDEKGDVFF